MASQLIVQPLTEPLSGSVPLPGDQDIALARLALAALARGRTTVPFAGPQRRAVCLTELLALLGVECSYEDGGYHVRGTGLFDCDAPTGPIDLRGEAHVAALALALLVSRPFESVVLVDEIVAKLLAVVLSEAHPMKLENLESGGCRVNLLPGSPEERPPGLRVQTHGVYPWVKQAILLAGVRAASPTSVEERLASADHLERALLLARMPLDVQGTVAVLHPPRDADAVAPQVYEAVGSQALSAPLTAAALMHPGSRITLREVGTNPSGTVASEIARSFGATGGLTPRGDRQGEPYGDLTVEAGTRRATSLGGETMVRAGDAAIPFFAAAALSPGVCRFSDLVAGDRGADPRVWGRVAGLVSSGGAQARVVEGVLEICGIGGTALEPLVTTTGGDSRLALLASVMALGAKGASVIDDVDCLASTFPRWVGTLRALGAQIEVRQV